MKMNKRVWELSNQALDHANKTWDPTSDPAMYMAIVLDKHAELIAQECAQECLYEADKWRGLQDITDFKLCALVIKERFGLE